MSLKVCVLSSGSSGNCAYVASDTTGILIDAGLSCKETAARLAAIGVELQSISAICLTHEHDDHKSSLGILHRKTGAALYANSGTIDALGQDDKLKDLKWNMFSTGSAFQIGDIRIEPFSVPHDSYDPVGFALSDGSSRVGVVTDMGIVTDLIRERLKGCQVIVLESNHDTDMLKASQRPWSLKQRIAGRQGHLSNKDAAELLAEVAGDTLTVVFLAHLSSDCNKPDVAVKTVQKILAGHKRSDIAVKLTYPDRASEFIQIGK